ncbi:MAG: outer membrane beta-barrel protein, partial [Octadecabacter sp.]
YSDVEPSVYEYLQDSAIGVFAGYNWQRGNLVYGGELNVTEGSLVLEGYNEELDTTIELRGRVGYAMGDALVYGFFGYGMSEYVYSSSQHDVAGGTYGLGIDYMVTDSIFAGLEVSNRELTGTTGTGTDQTNYIDMISLRIGYNY